MRVYQSLVRSVKGESYEVFKRTVKREKICACDHCGTGGNRGVSVYILRISLAENCEISDPVCLSCCSGIYRFKKNTDSQSASDYDACGKSHASDWRDRSRACMVEGMSEICIWRPWSWSGDFSGSLVFVKKEHWNGRCKACGCDRLVSGRLPDLV